MECGKMIKSKELLLKNKVFVDWIVEIVSIQSNPVKKTFLALCFEVEN
mgnify:CR=1 FL=1